MCGEVRDGSGGVGVAEHGGVVVVGRDADGGPGVARGGVGDGSVLGCVVVAVGGKDCEPIPILRLGVVGRNGWSGGGEVNGHGRSVRKEMRIWRLRRRCVLLRQGRELIFGGRLMWWWCVLRLSCCRLCT